MLSLPVKTAFLIDLFLAGEAASSPRSVQFLTNPKTCVRSMTFHPYSQSYPDKLWITHCGRPRQLFHHGKQLD